MELTIRPAAASEEPQIVALWRACGLIVPWNDPAGDFRFALGRPNSDILVATDSRGQILGSVMVGHDGHRGWVYYVSAHPDHRRSGIGRAVMQAAEEWLKVRNVPKLQLMIRESNTQVVRFYEQIGFEPMPRLLMQKWLKAPD